MQGHSSRFTPLAAPHDQVAPIKVKVAELDIARFLRAQADVGEQRQQRAVAETDGLVFLSLHGAQYRVYCIIGQRARATLLQRKISNTLRRVLAQKPLGDQPIAEAAQGREPTVNRRRLALLDILPVTHPSRDVFLEELRRIKSPAPLMLPLPSKCLEIGASRAKRRRLTERCQVAVNEYVHDLLSLDICSVRCDRAEKSSLHLIGNGNVARGEVKVNTLSATNERPRKISLPIRISFSTFTAAYLDKGHLAQS